MIFIITRNLLFIILIIHKHNRIHCNEKKKITRYQNFEVSLKIPIFINCLENSRSIPEKVREQYEKRGIFLFKMLSELCRYDVPFLRYRRVKGRVIF